MKTILKINYMENWKEREIFIIEYNNLHKCCPKCGSTSNSTTLTNYLVNLKKKDEYKDLNDSLCFSCGDKHKVHDRVPEKQKNLVMKSK